MPYLNSTVRGFNQTLINQALCFLSSGQINAFGICETVTEGQKKYPADIDDTGNANPVSIDDKYGIILYHRLDNIQNRTADKGYGDSQGDLIETANLTLTLFAFRNKIRRPVQDIEALIKDKMPELRMTLKNPAGLIIQDSVFKVGNSSFDRIAIEQKEFLQVDIDYPDITAFQMSYIIESTWKKGCLSTC